MKSMLKYWGEEAKIKAPDKPKFGKINIKLNQQIIEKWRNGGKRKKEESR